MASYRAYVAWIPATHSSRSVISRLTNKSSSRNRSCGSIAQFATPFATELARGEVMAPNRAFGDPDLTPDNFSSFSKQEVSADSAAVGLALLERFPPARSTTPMDLATVIGATAATAIQNAGQITFHTVGDTGGIHSPQFQFAVADALA